MKKRLRKYITMIAAVAMCSGMVLTDVHATGIYVDEGAASAAGDNQEQTQQQPEQEQQESSQPQENEQLPEDKSVTKAEQSGTLEKQEQVIDESLAALISGQETIQSAFVKARSAELANEKAVRAAGAMADLNIATGDIVISNGSYEQTNGLSGATDNTYVIEGTSFTNSITVKSGANPTITINDLKIDLKDLTSSSPKAAIAVEPGASVNLILAGTTGASQLAGSQLAAGISLNGTARLIVRGTGTLEIVGGAGAYAVGNNDSSGGTFGVAVETAKIRAYSNRSDMAIRTNNLYTTVKILQGALAVGKVDQVNTQFVNVENRDARPEKYQLTLPINYRAFATTTTQKGGEYVSYFPDKTVDTAGKVKDGKLLADGSTSYVYGLVSQLTATLSELTDQTITFTVTQDANGGKFPSDGQEKRLVTNVGYGTKISEPEKPERTAQYTEDKWYLDREPAFSAVEWQFGSNEVVKDTILYMNWIPDECIVEFNQNFTSANPPPAISRPYNGTVPLSASKVDKYGNYTLEGWYTDSAFKQKWEFEDPAIPGSGDRVRKEKMTLYAKWLAPCAVTFNKNTADTVEDVPANLTNVPATTKIKDPGTGDDPKIPKRSNYVFTGWYTSSACTTKWDFNKSVTASFTLFAGWVAAETIVTFDPGTDGNITTGEQVVVPNDGYIPEPPAGTVKREARVDKPTEYVLDGWYTDTRYTKRWNFDEDRLSTANGQFKLYAKWHQAQCYVTLNAKDTGAYPQQSEVIKSYEENLTADELAAKFVKKGYSITNWLKGNTRWNFADPVTEDIVLDAVWTVNNYDVNFHISEDPNDPGVPLFKNENDKKMSVKYDTALTRPIYPRGATKEEWPGHTFLGWYKSQDENAEQWKFSDVEAPAVPDLIEDHDTDLYAKWKLDDYNLTWHLQYGNNQPEIDEKIYHYGNKVDERKPERSNYIFKGWYTDPECSAESKWNFESGTIKGHTDLYAKWQGEPRNLVLTIKYEESQEGADDGKVVVQEPIKVYYGDTLKQEDLENEMNEDAKKRPGYTLNGWYTDEAHTNKWKFDADSNPDIIKDNSTKLYAYWTRDVYTIHFDTYEGDTVNNIEDIQSYYGYTIDEPEKPLREPHYTFGGWYSDKEMTEDHKWDFANEVTGNMTLYAKWIPNIYTLTFETNGGSKLAPLEVTYGTYPDPAALDTKKEGYVIEGWYRDSTFTPPAFDPQKELVTEDNMTLFVKWKLEEYTVTFHYLESKDSDIEEIEKDETLYNVNNLVKQPVKVLEHKTLSKWYQDKGMQERWVFGRDKIKKSMDLYAYWSDTQYEVHFETFGGTEIEDTKHIWGTLLEAPTDPERTGYTFNGWFKNAGQEEVWDFEEDYVDGDTTIFSGWTANMYTVTFDVNGGTGEIAAQTLPFGSRIAQPAAPTREKYKFTGWKVGENARATVGADWNFNNDTVDGDIALTAQWTEETSTDPGTGDAGTDGNGSTGGTGSNGTANTANGTSGSGTGTGTSGTGTSGTGSTTDATSQAVKDAANGLANILTGDKAPLTYSIAGAIVGVFMLAWALKRKFK